jgi:hypothetical protein
MQDSSLSGLRSSLLVKVSNSSYSQDQCMYVTNQRQEIAGVKTEAAFVEFADHLLLCITQMGKLGSLVSYRQGRYHFNALSQ